MGNQPDRVLQDVPRQGEEASELNLIIAGKIVYMAWEILKLQSEQVLQRVDRPEQIEMMFDGWDPDRLDIFVDPFELGTGEHPASH